MNKTVLEMNDTEYLELEKFNKSFRDYYWYERGHHINERLIRFFEQILSEYNEYFTSLEDIKKIAKNDIKVRGFEYKSSYEYDEIIDKMFILIEYIEEQGE